METAAPDLQVDDKNAKAFLSFFKSIPQENGVVAIFDRKTCYSVHGEYVFMVARFLYRSTAQVSYLGGQEKGLPGITFGANLLPVLLRELLVDKAENCVELYEGSGGSWKRTKYASPAKLSDFEDELNRGMEGMTEVPLISSVSMAVTEGARVVGLAFVDPSRRELGTCEFVDDDHFCHLETALVQLGAKECVMPKPPEGSAASVDAKRLADVVSRCGAMASERPRAAFAPKGLEQDLGRLLKGGCVEQYRPILERPQAAAALAGLLSFSELLSDSSTHGKYILALHDTGRYMRLDSAAQRALNVLKSKTDASDTFSLYGLLNRGKTPMGKRLLKVWLKQPLVDLDEINSRHDVVEAFVEDATLRQDLQQHLRGLPDIERLSRKLERHKATLPDLCQLYRASSRLPIIQSALEQHEGPHAELLRARYASRLGEAHDESHLSKFEELMEAAIDLDRVPDEYLIAPTYDQGLEELQVEKEGVEREIDSLAQEAAKDLGLVLDKTIKLEWIKMSNQKLRCLRITAKEEKLVRKKMARYIELETRKDGIKFTSTKLKAAAQRLQALSADYDSRQADLVAQVVSVAATFCEVWEEVCAVLAELDVLLAFADLSTAAPKPYVRPTMLPASGGELVLRGCRHPCVEAQDGVEFIANDCDMRRGSSWFQIITGPNMGGKSTFIRQVGVAVLMAQVGCFVPCDSARLSVRDCIFARVGAGDCQLRGVSTFMAEMLETAAILKGASANSLVIIDELGRGTSTYDGQALAWSISEHLMRDIGCATLFATHFHELTALRGDVGVKNLHVSTAIDEQSGSLAMLYQVNEGSCDQSFGIHVAEFAKFPPAVVELAKRKAQELEAQPEGQESASAGGGGDGSVQGAKRARQGSGSEDGGVLRAALLELAEMPLEVAGEEEARQRLQQWAARVAPLLPPAAS